MKNANNPNQNLEATDISVVILKRYKADERCELLFKLCIDDSLIFGVYLKEGNENAISTFDATPEEAESIFIMIHEGRLLPVHLEDIISDFKEEKLRLLIN